MTTGDGIPLLAGAITVVRLAWAAAWGAVRGMAVRSEALRRLGEHASWTTKTTTTRRAK